MPLNPNMKAIQTTSVGAGGASDIIFSSIPQTYTDLYIVCSVRATYGAVTDSMTVRLNGDSGTNYDYRGMRLGNGAAAITYAKTTYGIDNLFFMVDSLTGANNTSSTFSNVIIHIPNYTSSNQKSLLMEGASEGDSTDTNRSVRGQFSGKWANTSAITTVRLAPFNSNFTQYSTATLYGVTSAAIGVKGTGGVISEDDNYWYHTFTASGTFTPTQNLTADYLVVAGGGGGGAAPGYNSGFAGGGGAGGLRCTVTATGGGSSLPSALSLTSSTAYTITVGGGGASITNTRGGNNGNNSSISGSGITTVTSTAGGGGGSVSGVVGVGAAGGSGGGGGAGADPLTGGAGTTDEGYAGGNSNSAGSAPGGGGGGAGAIGGNQANGVTGGIGGDGVATIISGTLLTYAGGGGGGSNAAIASVGGAGGGGAGGLSSGNGVNGQVNTGGGGGGSGSATSSASGAGGSGIVILRYAK